MAFSIGKTSVSLTDILNKVSEADILAFYLGIKEIPCIIKSPLRKDNRPSFGLYSKNGKKISYIDLATKDSGGTFDILMKMWGCTFHKALERIDRDLVLINKSITVSCSLNNSIQTISNYDKSTDLKCKIRDWKKHDIDYWKQYGISVNWLKYADVYPISHKIIVKNGHTYTFGADKYAYAYVEFKEGKVTLKIYQPYNKLGYKWCNKHDNSVISLWTKVPYKGDKICVCASLKDALCLWANTGIPAIATQGEGYTISKTAIDNLKNRYKKIYICFDNDEAGIIDGKKLSKETGFTNVILPVFKNGKDISDLFYSLQDQREFNKIMIGLFK